MKKKLLSLMFLLSFSAGNLFAQQPINLIVGIDDLEPSVPGHPKMPPRIPVVEQDENQLIFEASHAEITLELIQDDEVVYSVVVPSTTTLVTIPTWVTGDCEIRLITGGTFYFYGYITLQG